MQKKAWRAFAEKYDLTFTEGRIFESPKMEGYLNGVYINAYEGAELDSGGRRRNAILVEAYLNHEMPFSIVITKKTEQQIFQQLERQIQNNVKLKFQGSSWMTSNLLATDDEEFAQSWLTPVRLEAIQRFFAVPNSKPAFIGGPEGALIIIQLNVPLTDPRMIDKLLKRMRETVAVLEVPAFLPGATTTDRAEEELDENDQAETEAKAEAETEIEAVADETEPLDNAEEAETESIKSESAIAKDAS